MRTCIAAHKTGPPSFQNPVRLPCRAIVRGPDRRNVPAFVGRLSERPANIECKSGNKCPSKSSYVCEVAREISTWTALLRGAKFTRPLVPPGARGAAYSRRPLADGFLEQSNFDETSVA